MPLDVIILGAGVAGLSAAIDLSQAGTKVSIIGAPQQRASPPQSTYPRRPQKSPSSKPAIALADASSPNTIPQRRSRAKLGSRAEKAWCGRRAREITIAPPPGKSFPEPPLSRALPVLRPGAGFPRG